jgi:hypothetical protein
MERAMSRQHLQAIDVEGLASLLPNPLFFEVLTMTTPTAIACVGGHCDKRIYP